MGKNTDSNAQVQSPILVIEDDRAQCKLLVHTLKTEGLESICCESGQDALRTCRQQEIDIAILDLRLPDMDGVELLRELKVQNPNIKVIIYTGHASLESAMAAVNEEAFAYVNKISGLSELLGYVHRAYHLHLANHSEALEEEVRRQTEELRKANEDLKKEIAERKQIEEQLRFKTQLLDSVRESVVATDLEGRVIYWGKGAEQLYGYSAEEVMGKPVTFIVTPQEKQEEQARIQQTFETGHWSGQYVQRRQDGSSFWAETVISLVTDQHGEPAGFIGIDRDISERKQAEGALARHAQEMEALYETSLEIGAQLDNSTLLGAIVQRACTLLGTHMGGLYLLRSDGQILELVAGHHEPERYLGAILRPGEGVAGRVVENGEPLMIGNYRHWQAGKSPLKEMTGRILGVPLMLGQEIIGALNVFDQESGSFDEDDIRLLSLFAAQAAAAIKNAQLFEAEQAQRQLAEALHDVGTTLSATLDFEAVLDRLLDQIGQVVPYDAAIIRLIDEGTTQTVRIRHNEQFDQETANEMADLSLEIANTPNLRRMAETGRPLIVPDTTTQPDWVHFEVTSRVKSWAGAPIIGHQNQVIGFFSLDKIEVGFYRPEHADRLTAFAGQAAIALENARLFEQIQSSLKKTEALYQVTRSLIAFKSLPDVLQAVVDSVAEALPAHSVVLYTLNVEKQRVEKRVKGGSGADKIPFATFDELWTGLSGSVIREMKPAVSAKGDSDARENPDVQRLRAEESYGSIIIVPLRYWDEILGTMTAINLAEQRDFTKHDVELMMAMANQATVAIENARLFDQTYRRTQQLAILNELAQETTGLMEIGELCRTMAKHLHSIFNHRNIAIFILDPVAEDLVLQAMTGPYADQFQPEEYRQTVSQGLVGQVATTGETIVVDDVRQHPEFNGLPGPNIRSESAIPLKVGERVLGVLVVSSDQSHSFDESDITALTTAANQVAVALEKARLFDQTLRRARQLEALRQVSQNLIALRDVDTLLHQIVERAIELLDGDTGSIFLYRPEQELLELVATVGDKAKKLGFTLERGEGLAGKVWASGEPLLIGDYQAWPGKSPQWLDLSGAILGVPIQWGNEFLGVLTQGNGDQRRYTPEDATLLSQFADQAAIAIQNARLHEQTRKQGRQVQRILDAAPEGIVLLDSEHRVKLVNPAASVYLGLLASSGIGEVLTHLGNRPLIEFLTTPDQAGWHEVRLDDPTQAVFEVATQPMDTGPEAEGWVMILRNVTEDRKVRERAKQHAHLAAVGQLAAGIAHDFNNILTGIIGLAEITQMTPNLPESSKQDLEMIVQQSQRAAHLIRQILDFSRRSIIAKQPFDLMPFLKETITLLKRTIPEDIHITLEIEPSQEPFMIKADPAQIQQALTNLAVNARDAMPEGGKLEFKLSHLRLKSSDRPPVPEMRFGQWFVLSISDTGGGILPEHRPHLFEPFFTTKEIGQGTGLGLAQVYGIVKQHEGEIEVESQVGQGTTFTLYLPALVSAQEESAQPNQSETPRGQGQVILVAEDNSIVLEVLTTMLEHLGYQVLTATNGQEALEIYERHAAEIALVLTDMTMPGMGGAALFRALQQRDPGVNVVVVSGYPLELDTKDRLGPGVVDWIEKPINLNELAQAVSRSLSSGR